MKSPNGVCVLQFEQMKSHGATIVDGVDNWTNDNKMSQKKLKISFTSTIPELPPLHTGDTEIERVNVFKLFGVWFQNDLKWNTHVNKTVQKASKRLHYLRERRKI